MNIFGLKIVTWINLVFLMLGSYRSNSERVSLYATTKKIQNDYLNFNKLSEDFLQNTIKGVPTQDFEKKLANTTLEALENQIKTDAQRYAFWVNIYNAYIIIILSKHPKYYENKNAFFSNDQINIAGHNISFDKIEHGILRKSKWKNGLGYISNWFSDSFERKLRVNKRDFRIHFVLNCGAKDCPPVAIYTPDKVLQQFEKNSINFLKRTTTIKNDKTVRITPLFKWFRGDFDGKNGIKKILMQYGIIESTKGITLEFTHYDWTLKLDNYIDLE